MLELIVVFVMHGILMGRHFMEKWTFSKARVGQLDIATVKRLHIPPLTMRIWIYTHAYIFMYTIHIVHIRWCLITLLTLNTHKLTYTQRYLTTLYSCVICCCCWYSLKLSFLHVWCVIRHMLHLTLCYLRLFLVEQMLGEGDTEREGERVCEITPRSFVIATPIEI